MMQHVVSFMTQHSYSVAVPFALNFLYIPPVYQLLNFYFPLDRTVYLCYSDSMNSLVLQNPLLRERLKLNLTQHDIAEELGITRNFIVRAESAEYPEPPKNVLEYYAGGDKFLLEVLQHEYKAYQLRQRQEHYGMLYPYFETPEEYLSPGGAGQEHPLTYWALRTTQINPEAPGISIDLGGSYPYPPTLYALCRAFCVHHAVMHRWVREVKTVKRVPKVFLAALFDAGYSEQSLIALEGAYELHRSALLEIG